MNFFLFMLFDVCCTSWLCVFMFSYRFWNELSYYICKYYLFFRLSVLYFWDSKQTYVRLSYSVLHISYYHFVYICIFWSLCCILGDYCGYTSLLLIPSSPVSNLLFNHPPEVFAVQQRNIFIF